jgi:cytochrome c2
MKFVYGIVLAFVLSITTLSAQNDVTKGKKMFNSNCAACHRLDKRLIGPALGNISERRDLAWTIEFIKDSRAMISKGDKDAIAIFNKFNKIPMISYSYLKDEQILNIIAYLNTVKKK